MSGNMIDTTTTAQQSGTDPAVAAASETDPAANDSTSAATPSGSGADVLTQSEWTRRFIVACATVTVCASILAAVAAMVYRTVIDGNAPVTTDITTKLSLIAVGGIIALAAALFGSNNVLSKIIEKLL